MVFKLSSTLNLNNFNIKAFMKKNIENKSMFQLTLQNINIINQISFS